MAAALALACSSPAAAAAGTGPTGTSGAQGATGASSTVVRPASKARTPARQIPFGSALWYACTEPVFAGPLILTCPQPYNPLYLETFLKTFSRFTPENEFKMMFLEPEENRFNFTVADQIARFAIAYHKTIRGHTLLWDAENPLWLSHPLLPWGRTELIWIMRTYITTVVSHFAKTFPGVVTEWDVVNEPIANSGLLQVNPWERVIGAQYIPLALQAAHAADPNAQLVINDQSADNGGAHEAAMLKLATTLKQQDVPLNAIGFEEHTTPDTAPTLGHLLWLWKQYRAIGLNVEVTELDVDDDPGVTSSAAAKQAIFERFALACSQSPNCTGMSVWGVADRYSWLGPDTTALLFNDAFEPLPVVAVIHDLLEGLPLPGAAPAHKAAPATAKTTPATPKTAPVTRKTRTR